MTPVERIREASRLMRERAEAATQNGRWTLDRFANIAHGGPLILGCGDCAGSIARGEDAEHITASDPAVMLAVAAMLDEVADSFAKRGVCARLKPHERSADALARAYLRELYPKGWL